MNRRTFIGTLGFGVVGLAGCSGSPDSESSTASPTPAEPTAESSTVTPPPVETTTEPSTETPSPSPTAEPAPTTPGASDVQLLSIEAPKRAQIGESVRYRFTVENSGEQSQMVEPTVSSRTGTSDWTVNQRWGPIEVDPTERATFESSPISNEYLSTAEFRIDGYGETFDIEFEEKRLEFSDPYHDPLDREVSIEGLRTRSFYEYSSDGVDRIVEAGEGLWWAFATVKAVNRVSDSVDAPGREGFTLLDGEDTYQPIEILGDGGYEPNRLPINSAAQGLIGFKTPEYLPTRGLQVRWHESFENGDVGVIWTAE